MNRILLLLFLFLLVIVCLPAGPLERILPSTTQLSYGTVTVGKGETLVLTMTNFGRQSGTVGTINFSRPEYAVTGGTCHFDTVLQPGQSCTVDVTYAPSAVGPQPGQMTVAVGK